MVSPTHSIRRMRSVKPSDPCSRSTKDPRTSRRSRELARPASASIRQRADAIRVHTRAGCIGDDELLDCFASSAASDFGHERGACNRRRSIRMLLAGSRYRYDPKRPESEGADSGVGPVTDSFACSQVSIDVCCLVLKRCARDAPLEGSRHATNHAPCILVCDLLCRPARQL